MSSTRLSRNELVAAIGMECRRNSTRTVLFHTAIADRLGLNPSDHKCADILAGETGPVTPGRLAELTGLTPGAVTGVLDRLEKAGFIAREHDTADRRRVLVRLTPERTPDMSALFAPIANAVVDICERYGVEELGAILGFLRSSTEAMRDATRTLREIPSHPASKAKPSSK